jgi:hypothetical protein
MNEDLINRITYYLSSGGLFNPELADHLAVRNLLMECRDALAQRTEQEQQIETLKRCLFQMQEAAKDLVKQAKSLPPPQRTWVGLTDEERDAMIDSTDLSGAYYYDDLYAVILAAEAKLKEKNT